MIDHIVKDAVLAIMLRNHHNLDFETDLNNSEEVFGYSPEIVEAISEYFVRIGLITNIVRTNEGYNLYKLNVEVFDFANHGGFRNQEELLEKNIHKLLLEIEALKPAMPDKVKTLTEISSSILSGLDIMHKWGQP